MESIYDEISISAVGTIDYDRDSDNVIVLSSDEYYKPGTKIRLWDSAFIYTGVVDSCFEKIATLTSLDPYDPYSFDVYNHDLIEKPKYTTVVILYSRQYKDKSKIAETICCPLCNRTIYEIDEYLHNGYMGVEKYAKNDGTYSEETNRLCCTRCYVEHGHLTGNIDSIMRQLGLE